MPQIGIPQKSIQEILGSDFPATTPEDAGKSSFILGQNLTEAESKQSSLPTSDLTPIPSAFRTEIGQPDKPQKNTKKSTQVPSTATDANGNRIKDSDRVFATGREKGAFDIRDEALDKATKGEDQIKNLTVPAAPLTTGFGSGYGAMSGGTPKGEESDGYGNFFNTQAVFADIDRVGSRNHASMNVISRPGASLPFLF